VFAQTSSQQQDDDVIRVETDVTNLPFTATDKEIGRARSCFII
jgi:hypothetical protein